MPQRILLRSVGRRLPDGVTALAAVHLWSRHRWSAPYALIAFVSLLVVATVAGFDTWFARIGLGLAGAALASTATTEYRILADTTRGLAMLRSSRIRQYATELLAWLPPDTEIERRGTTMVSADWAIEGQTYTTSRRASDLLAAIAAR